MIKPHTAIDYTKNRQRGIPIKLQEQAGAEFGPPEVVCQSLKLPGPGNPFSVPLNLRSSLQQLLLPFGTGIYPATAKLLAALLRGANQQNYTVSKVFEVGAFFSALAPPSKPSLSTAGTQAELW